MEFNVDMIYTLIIGIAPSITSVITVIVALLNAIKKFTKVDGSLDSLKETTAALSKENAELKKELKKVYKLHSEVVEHIYYKESTNGEQKN